MQKAAITMPNFFSPHFASYDESLPYCIIYLTFQDSRNVPNIIIEFSYSPHSFCSCNITDRETGIGNVSWEDSVSVQNLPLAISW